MTKWFVMDLHLCHDIEHCIGVTSAIKVAVRLGGLDVYQCRAIRFVTEIAKRLDLCYCMYTSEDLSSMGVKSCMFREMALVAFAAPNAPPREGPEDASAASADTVFKV